MPKCLSANSIGLKGVGYVGKGSVVSIDALTTTTLLNYGELTVSALRKLTFTNIGVFYLGVGPYLAMGLNGTLDYETPGSDTKDKLLFGKDNDVMKFDAGLYFTTGFEFRNRVTFNIGYALGLNNIASDPQRGSGTTVVKNREFLIGLGYRFR
ncbi:outer membrane beta-barrel protein [Mucilaginibacter antarcticus]|uniref:outer membrane beta-barrel protein n=1 Tax=Mucilaginibacter antarcticus TaxID=1855725 RepID=UPI003630CF36